MFITHKIILDRLVPVEITEYISAFVDTNNAEIDLKMAKKHNRNKIHNKTMELIRTSIYTLDDLVHEYLEVVSKQSVHITTLANRLVVYRALYKNNGKFRNFIKSKIPKGLLENDPIVKAKTTILQKLVAEATFTWNYIKTYHIEIINEFDLLYKECKKIYG
ncbi:hypothetical protein PV-S19_0086 [Pacmanvirus S19]|nr:hypothetical protein PV-S19_0086 [Pacmanvirus S19]